MPSPSLVPPGSSFEFKPARFGDFLIPHSNVVYSGALGYGIAINRHFKDLHLDLNSRAIVLGRARELIFQCKLTLRV